MSNTSYTPNVAPAPTSPKGDLVSDARNAGFSDAEIGQWVNEQKPQFKAAGFNDEEINSYFSGLKQPSKPPQSLLDRLRGAFASDTSAMQERAGFGKAPVEGFEQGAGPAPSETAQAIIKEARQVGVFPPAGKPGVGLQFANEAVLGNAVKGVDAFFRVINGMLSSAGAVGGQVAARTGEQLGHPIDVAYDAVTGQKPVKISDELEEQKARMAGIDLVNAFVLSEMASPMSRVAPRPVDFAAPHVDQVVGYPATSQDFTNATKIVSNDGSVNPKVRQKLIDLYEKDGIHPAEVAHDEQIDPTIKPALNNPNPDVVPERYVPNGQRAEEVSPLDTIHDGSAVEAKDAVYQDVRTKLLNAGLSDEEATVNASLWAARYAARSELLTGSQDDALRLYNKEGLEVRRGEPPVPIAEAAEQQRNLDEANQRSLFQAPTFFSAAQRAIETSTQEKASPEQWLRTLRNTPGIKAEELDWLGLPDWLGEQKGAVTKQAVSDYVRANQIEVKEIAKGPSTDVAQAERDRLREALLASARRGDIASEQADMLWRAAVAGNADAIGDIEGLGIPDETISPFRDREEGGPTKFSRWQLPGGENYRELLLTLPPVEKNPKRLLVLRAAENRAVDEGDQFEAEYAGRLRKKEEGRGNFQSQHWDEPNVIAHVRFNDRTINGKKTLFIEEVQSDWHQRGKRVGYRAEFTPAIDADLINGAQIAKAHGSPAKWEFHDVRTGALEYGWGDTEAAARADALRHVNSEMRRDLSENKAGVPDAPFKTTWPELALKRMIRYAAENGYDKIAWTPGDVQAERYDLSKQIEAIDVFKDGHGNYEVRAHGANGHDVIDDVYPAEKLPDVVGKDLAKMIVDETPGDGSKKTFSGLALKVGGDGMEGFYDKILPAAANKLVKKYGTKVGTGDVHTEDLRQGGPTHAAHVIDITPQLRQAATEQGFPLFQRSSESEPRGRIIFDTNRALIELFGEADKSTFAHESGHLFLDELVRDASTEDAPPQLKADLQSVMDWMGVKKAEDISVEHHEQWARGFERYLAEGKAPTAALQHVFDAFKRWLISIYRSLNELNVPITDEIRGVYDRLLRAPSELGKEQEPIAATEAVSNKPLTATTQTNAEPRLFEQGGKGGGNSEVLDLRRKKLFTYDDRGGFRKAFDKAAGSWKSSFQPQLVSDAALKADPLFARYKSRQAMRRDQAIAQAEEEHEYWRKQSPAERSAYLNAAQQGKPMRPEWEAKWERQHKILDEAHTLETKYGSKAAYVEDYLPQIWEDPQQARAFFAQRQRQLGPTWFQKERAFQFIEEGEAAGLRLKNSNPEDLVTLRLLASADMVERMDLLHRLRSELQLATPSKGADATLPYQGWFEVVAPNREKWLLSPDIEPLWRNGVEAKGLWANEGMPGSVFRGWMALKNAWVPIKLAISLFHPLHVLHINWTEGFAQAWRQLAREHDPVGALKSAAEGIYGPFQGAIPGVATRGKEAREAWLIPDEQRTPTQKALVGLMNDGGFVPQLSEELKVSGHRALEQALDKQQWIRALPAAMRRGIEVVQAPIFEKWIPSLKASAYLNEADALFRRRPELIDDATQRRVALRTIAKSIDNRFGEMFYGTLFWDRYAKDAGIGSFLSLGWNLGFSREFGGALLDPLGRTIRRVSRGPETETEATIREAQSKLPFVVSYVAGAMLLNGLMTYGLSGEQPTGLDWFLPRVGRNNPDGSPHRITNMFYTREAIMAMKHIQERGGNIVTGLGEMLWNKLMFEPFKELINNKDYYGAEIWDENAPLYLKGWQAVRHVFGDQFSPMAISGAQRAKQSGGGIGEQALSLLGFGPAPSYAERTATQNRIYYLYGLRHGGTRPLEQAEKQTGEGMEAYLAGRTPQQGLMDLRAEIMLARQRRDWPAAEAAEKKWLEIGGSKASLHNIILGIGSDITLFKQLPESDQKAVLAAAPPAERAKYEPYAAHHTARDVADLMTAAAAAKKRGDTASATEIETQAKERIRQGVSSGEIQNPATFRRQLSQEMIDRHSPELGAILSVPKQKRPQFMPQIAPQLREQGMQ